MAHHSLSPTRVYRHLLGRCYRFSESAVRGKKNAIREIRSFLLREGTIFLSKRRESRRGYNFKIFSKSSNEFSIFSLEKFSLSFFFFFPFIIELFQGFFVYSVKTST